MKPEILITGQGRKIAYHQTKGKGAGIVFLGGFHLIWKEAKPFIWRIGRKKMDDLLLDLIIQDMVKVQKSLLMDQSEIGQKMHLK